MVLNALYVCLHAFPLHQESPDPEDGPLISELVLSQNGIRARSGLNTHSKHIKVTTTFMVRIS
jgi:hypothetical protein